MDKSFHQGNRQKFYDSLENGTIALFFSGHAFRKTADEFFPFYANRNFVYLTGIEKENFVLMAEKQNDQVHELLFILPPDAHAERWTGRRMKADEVLERSCITETRYIDTFPAYLHMQLRTNRFDTVALDLYRCEETDEDTEPFIWADRIRKDKPSINIIDSSLQLRKQRTIKQPCEIAAIREAAKITRAGIVAMMKAAKPGIWEYQLKAEFDYALAQHGDLAPAFPSIVSAGDNNFCIHYYDYTGQAKDGDMILNDVGAKYDNLFNDVSRGYPVNGKFSERQKQLYMCAYNTSQHMFSIIKPGMKMRDVDRLAREFNFEQLKALGLCDKLEEVGKYIWHGGAHHVGYDTHDLVEAEIIEPGMVFCVDIGIYCEEWGIGFRLEDNCLVTENGCENLTGAIPRTIEDIEAVMAGKMD